MVGPTELVVRTGAALREPYEDVPSLLERLGDALDASALVVLRSLGPAVIVDYAWRVHEWLPGTKAVDGFASSDLEMMAPVQVAHAAASAADIPPQLWWDAGRATTAPVVIGIAGAAQRFPERAVNVLATTVDVIVARENASLTSRTTALLQERARMGSAIHEGVVQDLATLTLQLEMLGEMIRRDPERARQLATEARVAATNALDHARSAILDLTPVVPDNSWVVGGLKRFVDDFACQWGLDMSVVLEGSARPVEPDALGLVFAFVREALTNLRKHSSGRRGDVQVLFEEGALLVCVRNEATTTVPNDRSKQWPSGQGIKLMRCRARLLGGDVRLSRPHGDETHVTLRLPLKRRIGG